MAAMPCCASMPRPASVRLALLADPPRVYGLYAQSPAASWESERPALDAIAASLSLERGQVPQRPAMQL